MIHFLSDSREYRAKQRQREDQRLMIDLYHAIRLKNKVICKN